MVQNAFFTAPKSLQSRVEWYLILVKISPKVCFLYAKTGFWDDEKLPSWRQIERQKGAIWYFDTQKGCKIKCARLKKGPKTML